MTATDQTDETSALIATLAGLYYTSADVSAREQSRNAWTCTIVECDWLYTADVFHRWLTSRLGDTKG